MYHCPGFIGPPSAFIPPKPENSELQKPPPPLDVEVNPLNNVIFRISSANLIAIDLNASDHERPKSAAWDSVLPMSAPSLCASTDSLFCFSLASAAARLYVV